MVEAQPRRTGPVASDGFLRLSVYTQAVGGRKVVFTAWTLSENRPVEDTTQWYLDRVALKRRGTDQEIANAVTFLASDLASFITGVYLPVCGGTVMPGI